MSDDTSTASRRRRPRRHSPNDDRNTDDDQAAHLRPTPDEKTVARYLRFGLKECEGKLVGIVVKVFSASEALDFLMESRFAQPDQRKTPYLFPSRDHAESFMAGLLNKRLFHRAEKVKKKSRRSKSANSVTPTGAVSTKKTPRSPTATPLDDDDDTPDQSAKPTDDTAATANDDTAAKPSSTTKKDKLAGKKARVKLEMHDDQRFLDGDNTYVWIYDPIRPMNLVLGVLILVVVVVCCLFPLWPAQLRTGAYYLSLGGMGLLGSLFGLSLLRAVLFGLVWLVTAGRHHFWLLPNLTEDCGFCDSFVPAYSYEVSGGSSSSCSKGAAGDKKKE